MVRQTLTVFSILLLGALVVGCGGSKDLQVATVGNDQITLPDFERQFAKSNGGEENASQLSLEERRKFLDLLVKFRLKVNEAKRRGLLTDPEVSAEIAQYQAAVATSYMLEKELVEPGLREMYNRHITEVRASHILVTLPEENPADTISAYNEALEIIQLVKKGIPFDSLAAMYSKDPSAKDNRGDLGYFSVNKMVPEFEDAAFALQPGEVSQKPVRTQFGYHVIKITDRKPNNGPRRISHILRRFLADMSDTDAVADSMRSIYRRITDGTMTFEEAVSKYTDDTGSKIRGGDIGYYERDQVPYIYNMFIWNLPLNVVSEPLRTPYGYHIFKVTDMRPIQTYEEMEKSLRQQYQNLRYQRAYDAFLASIRSRYPVTFDSAAVEKFSMSFDTLKNLFTMSWADTLTPEVRALKLFSVGKSAYTGADFVTFAGENRNLGTAPLTPSTVRFAVDKMVEAKLLEEESKKIPDRYPAFRELMAEYTDGILLYTIEQEEVWQKVVVNDSLLRDFYEKTKENYTFPNRVQFSEIFVRDEAEAKNIHRQLVKGVMKIDSVRIIPPPRNRRAPRFTYDTTYIPVSFAQMAEEHTVRAGYKERKGDWGMLRESENQLSEFAYSQPEGTISEPFSFQGSWSIIKTVKKDPARMKTFEEAGPELASAYQDYASKKREAEWVESLKKRFPVQIFEENLQKAFTGTAK